MTMTHRKASIYFPALIFIHLVLISAGCSKRPKEILSEKDMVSLMTDMQLAEAYSNVASREINGANGREEIAEGVLARHGISREQLDTTLSWYGRNIDEYAELFEKVDLRIKDKKKRLIKDDEPEVLLAANHLWPYREFNLLSPLGNSDGLIFSIMDPEVENGDLLEWSMRVGGDSYSLVGVLGVDYDNGTSEAYSSSITGHNQVKLELQTDTGKSVKRIYGTLRLRERVKSPLYADSIRLVRHPYDSLEYLRYRNQKRYAVPARKIIRKEEIEERQDSISEEATDSIALERISENVVKLPTSPSAQRERKTPANKKARSIEEVKKQASRQMTPPRRPQTGKNVGRR